MDLTVLICTYNRRDDVLQLLDTVQSQDTGGRFRFEVIVVDNNSTDGTVDALQNRPGIQILTEKRQGKSYALQTGIAMAKGEILFIVDSDQLLPPGYLLRAWDGIRQDPNLAIYGGKVLPLWPAPPPKWLTKDHWGPLAMLDFGDQAFRFGAERPLCLLVPLFRMAPLRALGGFKLDMSVSKDKIGGVEDADLAMRLVRAGYQGYYDPSLVISHKVEPNRLTRSYHRRWYRGHGYFRAKLRDQVYEQASFRVLGIPSHVLRSAAISLLRWAGALLRGDWNNAFRHETKLWDYWGYMRQRVLDRNTAVPLEEGW